MYEVIPDSALFVDTSFGEILCGEELTDLICEAVDASCSLSTPLKGSCLFPDERSPKINGVISTKDQSLYLSPMTRHFQHDIQTAAESV